MDRHEQLAVPSTIYELLRLRSQASPTGLACYNETAANHYQPWEWQAYHERTLHIACVLQHLGISHGKVVAILLPTCLDFELISHAALRLAAIVVGLECQSSGEDLRRILDRSNACLIVTTQTLWAGMGHPDFCNASQTILFADSPSEITTTPALPRSPTGESSKSTATLREQPANLWTLVDTTPKTEISHLASPPTSQDIATIIYTSGTTGDPKGIAFSHEQVMLACDSLTDVYSDLGPRHTTICWLPLSHLFQRMANLFAMASGMTTYFVNRPRAILEYVRDIRPDFLIGVPRFFEKLHETIESGTMPGLETGAQAAKYMVSGSAPLPTSLLNSFNERGILILEAYGLSENTVPIAMNRAGAYRFNSVGKPLPQNQVRLGRQGELAGESEIEVKGMGLFSGYLDSREADCFTDDGFYRTGDLGHFDDDGFLFLTGRAKDIIKTSTGRRIGPARIEAIYARSPFVHQIVVVGNGQKYLVALLTLSPTAKIDQQDDQSILEHLQSLAQDLTDHEKVQAFAILPGSFRTNEITASQKLKRNTIAQNYDALIDRLYSHAPPCILRATTDEAR